MTLLEEIEDGDISADSALLRRTVPGYDYRVRERGVETDRRIRAKIDRDLGDATKTLEDVTDGLYRRGERDRVERVDRLVAAVERVRQRVTTATTGGGAVRNLAVEDQEALLALVEYDARLLADVEAILEHVDELRAAAEAGRPVESIVRGCERDVATLDRTFTRRQDHMEGLIA